MEEIFALELVSTTRATILDCLRDIKDDAEMSAYCDELVAIYKKIDHTNVNELYYEVELIGNKVSQIYLERKREKDRIKSQEFITCLAFSIFAISMFILIMPALSH